MTRSGRERVLAFGIPLYEARPYQFLNVMTLTFECQLFLVVMKMEEDCLYGQGKIYKIDSKDCYDV